MKLVDEQDIINTYSEKEQLSCKKYFEYKKLLQENPSFGYKRCAKLLGVKAGQVRWWHNKGEKRAVPLPLKKVEILREAGFIPFAINHKHCKHILRILGTLFGDGGIDIRLNTMAFISSFIEDINLWKEDLINIFPFVKEKISIVEGGEWGHSYNVRTFDRSVIRFFVALGTPVGNKVSAKYSLPKYIFDLPNNLKISFLDGLLSSEVSVPKFRTRPAGRTGQFFSNLELGLSKIDLLEKEHRKFLNELKRLCDSLGFPFTPNLKKDMHKPRNRKDGHTSYCYRIFFQTHFDKVLYFNDKFELRYASNKKKRLRAEVEKALAYKNSNPNTSSRWYLRAK